MTIDLYYVPYSPPCRSPLMLAEALKIKLNLKLMNAKEGDLRKPEFIEINPQHLIPTIVDDGFALWESRAILTYLATKYGDGSLYPADPKLRAIVDQRLYFDMGTLYQRFSEYFIPQLFSNAPADAAKLKKLEEALEFLNTFLDGSQWVAGSTPSVADFSILSSIFAIKDIDIDIFKYPNIKAWYERAKSSLPGFHICEESTETFKKVMADYKAANTSS